LETGQGHLSWLLVQSGGLRFLQTFYWLSITDPSGDAIAYLVDFSKTHLLDQVTCRCAGAVASAADQDYGMALMTPRLSGWL